jgi:hypothetical protein
MVSYEPGSHDSREPSQRHRTWDSRDARDRDDERFDSRRYDESDRYEDERAMRERRRDDEPIDPRGYGNAGGSEAGPEGTGYRGRGRSHHRSFNFGQGARFSPQNTDAFGGLGSVGQPTWNRNEGALRSGSLRQHNDAGDLDPGPSRLSHRGKGPKGYARSDARIQEDVSDRLTEDHDLDASSIEVLVKDGEVTLAGSVESRECKRRAEDLADDISGVKHVQNNLRITSAGSSSSKDR